MHAEDLQYFLSGEAPLKKFIEYKSNMTVLTRSSFFSISKTSVRPFKFALYNSKILKFFESYGANLRGRMEEQYTLKYCVSILSP